MDNFHKFYERIEHAHAILTKNIETGDVKESMQYDELKSPNVYKEEFIDSSIETEILMEQPLSTEYVTESENPLIKEEQADETLPEEMPLKQRRRRGRPTKAVVSDLTNSTEDRSMEINLSLPVCLC